MSVRFWLHLWYLFCLVLLGGCGSGGGSGPDPAPTRFTVSVTVSGLSGSGLVLENNNSESRTVTGNGAVSFTAADPGTSYLITIGTQPSGPAQTCVVTNGSGTLASSDVTNVMVTCATNTYTVGGTVSGLSGSGLVLSNGGEDLPVGANGNFVFTAAVASGIGYHVTVNAQPLGPSQTCTVSNETGTVTSSNVTNLNVACIVNEFSVGGTVGGLSGAGLLLRNNGGNDLAVSADGAITFTTPVASGNPYDITVATQPSNPIQACSVANGAGTVTNDAITAPVITCITQTPRIAYALNYYGGTISIYNVDPVTNQYRSRGYARTGSTPVDGNSAIDGAFTLILNSGAATSPASLPPIPAVASTVSVYAHSDVTGDMTEIAGSPFPLSPTPGAAGRLSVHPNGKFIYVTSDGGDDSIYGFSVNESTGTLTAVPGSPFAAGNTPSAVIFDVAGTHAYVTNRDSNDIYVYEVDAATGTLTEIPADRIATGTTPNALSMYPGGKFAYVVNRESGSVPGSISAYAVDTTSGALTALAGSPTPLEVNPAVERIYFHPGGKYLYVHNLGAAGSTGSLSGFSIEAGTGALAELPGSPYPTDIIGNTTIGSRSALDPNGRFIYVCTHTTAPAVPGPGGEGTIKAFSINAATGVLSATAGIDTLRPAPYSLSVDPSGRFLEEASVSGDLHRAYSIDQTTGALSALPSNTIRSGAEPVSNVAYTTSSGTPPVFKPRFAYVPNAGDNTISAFKTNADTGALSFVAAGASVDTSPQAIAVQPGGKFAYGIDADNGKISAYAIDQSTGALTATGSTLSTGSLPAAITAEPSGRFVYVANAGGSTISAYGIDATTGALTLLSLTADSVGSPVGVLADPTGRNLYVLGLSSIQTFTINNSTGTLGTPPFGISLMSLSTSGATQMVIEPRGRYLYVAIPAGGGSVEAYSLDTYSGSFLGRTVKATGHTNNAVTVDPTGHYLYTADFTDNSVTGYSIDATSGTLTALAAGSKAVAANALFVGAEYSGKYLYAVLSNKTVAGFSIDATTGDLTSIAGGSATGTSPGPITLFGDVE